MILLSLSTDSKSAKDFHNNADRRLLMRFSKECLNVEKHAKAIKFTLESELYFFCFVVCIWFFLCRTQQSSRRCDPPPTPTPTPKESPHKTANVGGKFLFSPHLPHMLLSIKSFSFPLFNLFFLLLLGNETFAPLKMPPP